MTEIGWMFAVFVVYHVACLVSWNFERNTLVNKIMSRSYHEYQFAKNVDKTLRPDGEALRDGIKAEEQLAEDLAPIQEFGLN